MCLGVIMNIKQEHEVFEKALGCSLENHSKAVSKWLKDCDKSGEFLPFYPYLDEVKKH